jgi:micrococcal nuclease
MRRRTVAVWSLAALILGSACSPDTSESGPMGVATSQPGDSGEDGSGGEAETDFAEGDASDQPGEGGSEPNSSKGAARGRPAEVSSVTDGDTVEVILAGSAVDVRLIGVDTPETVHPSQPVECFGQAASRFTRSQLEGERIRLEFDVERYDQYGRTLGYVWLGGHLFNEILVRRGFATVATYPPNVKYVDLFLSAERAARGHDRGLWLECPAEGGGRADEGGEGKAGQSRCDRSYPDVCIRPYPPDLDCAQVPYINFRVQGSDPHGFDGDADGIGCET